MINFDGVAGKNTIKHNSSRTYIPDHPYKILMIKKILLNLISHHPDIDKIYLWAKDPYEA